MQALPDLREKHWHFEAHTAVNTSRGETSATVWHYQVVSDDGYGVMPIDWKLTVTSDGEPVTLDMWGINWFTGGHWDHYTAQFYEFEANPDIPERTFRLPKICDNAAEPCAPCQRDLSCFLLPCPPSRRIPDAPPSGAASKAARRSRQGSTRCCRKEADAHPLLGGHHLTTRQHSAAKGILPAKCHGDAEYDAHAAVHGRTHAHRAEYERRRVAFYSSKARVAAHNADAARTFDMVINRFADWTREELTALTTVRTTPPFVSSRCCVLHCTRHGEEVVRRDCSLDILDRMSPASSVPRCPSLQASRPRRRDPDMRPPKVHQPTWPLHMLPTTVDYRGSDADSIVKDQSMCGSCWAFASIGPMETAYFRHFGA